MPDNELKNQDLTISDSLTTPPEDSLQVYTPPKKSKLGDNYSYTAGSKAITEMITTSPYREELRRNATYSRDKNGTKYIAIEKEDITLIIPELQSLKNEAKVLSRYLLSEWTDSNTIKKDILLSDYLAERHKDDSKEARLTIREAFTQLSSLRISMNHSSGAFKEMQFIVEPELTANGHIRFSFGEKFASEVLANASIIPYPRTLYQLSTRYDILAFTIGEKLNYHKFENKDKPNEGSISMVKLLEATGLPTVEELRQQETRPSPKQKIISPTIKAIDTLNGLTPKQFIIRYMDETGHLLTDKPKTRTVIKNSGGKRREETITESDLDRMKYDIDFFMSLYVDFQILEYPRIESAEARQKRGKAINYKAQKKAQNGSKKTTD